MIINGIKFDYKGYKLEYPCIADIKLNDIHGKPSKKKLEVWENWVRFFEEAGIEVYGIKSYNAHIFTIHAYYTDKKGFNHYLVISPKHNYVYTMAILDDEW